MTYPAALAGAFGGVCVGRRWPTRHSQGTKSRAIQRRPAWAHWAGRLRSSRAGPKDIGANPSLGPRAPATHPDLWLLLSGGAGGGSMWAHACRRVEGELEAMLSATSAACARDRVRGPLAVRAADE